MIEKAKLIEAINIALEDLEAYPGDDLSILKYKKVLQLLKADLRNERPDINVRILRAMHDVGASSVREFEDTAIEISIRAVIKILYYEIPGYKNLEPLRMDFDKGDPI